MNKTTIILLLISEALLLLKLILNQDILLMMTIVLSQFVIVMAGFNFTANESASEKISKRKQFFVGLLVFLSITPLLIHHQNRFEPSTWSEAGLLIQGPFSILLVLLGVYGAVVAALTSLYLRGRR